MVSFLKALVYGAGGVAVVGMVALVAFQERLVYVPVVPGLARAYPITPARLRLDYEDVFLRASDGVRLHAWFIKQAPPKPGGSNDTLLPRKCWHFCHLCLCSCNLEKRMHDTTGMEKVMVTHHSMALSWMLRFVDVCFAALDHLTQRKDIDTSRIVIFGRSLGGAVGAVLVKDNPDKVYI
ncbi:hypothetical protein BHE74_00030503 [Ensete ventricosum]|nr:hypothetical protein BHE74_00030503 [Ensete ventricosum]